MSEYGIKIKNIKAGTLYDVNCGVRDNLTYTDAMLNNSLFSIYLMKNGLNVYKESTRDVVCLDFDFGSRSYETEKNRLVEMYNSSTGKSKEKIKYVLNRVEENKDKYNEKTRDKIREEFYNNGVWIEYKTRNKDGTIKSSTKIKYRMLFLSLIHI